MYWICGCIYLPVYPLRGFEGGCGGRGEGHAPGGKARVDNNDDGTVLCLPWYCSTWDIGCMVHHGGPAEVWVGSEGPAGANNPALDAFITSQTESLH